MARVKATNRSTSIFVISNKCLMLGLGPGKREENEEQ